MNTGCAPLAIFAGWPGAATYDRRVSNDGLFVLPKSRDPQFLLTRLRKLKMSSCRMRFLPAICGNVWRADRLTTLSHGERQELRFMIVPRCEFRHAWPLMKFSSESCCCAAVRLPLAVNRISVVSCAFFGTYRRSFEVKLSPFMSLP